MPAQVQKKEERDKYGRIIEAATKVFAEKGFFKATVADVARAAEVAEGTIYLYFKNKDDLLISIFETSMDMFIREVEQALEGITKVICGRHTADTRGPAQFKKASHTEVGCIVVFF